MIPSVGEGRIPRREHWMKGLEVKQKLLSRRGGRPQHTRGRGGTACAGRSVPVLAWPVCGQGAADGGLRAKSCCCLFLCLRMIYIP